MNNLKFLRKQRKLTQLEVAKAINTSQQNYSRYENGSIQADYSTLAKLANFFGVSTDYLLISENLSNYKKKENNAFKHIYKLPIYQSIYVDETTKELVTKKYSHKITELAVTDETNFFYYLVKDNSLKNSRILANDLLLCHVISDYKNNDLVIASSNKKTFIGRYKIIDNIKILIKDDFDTIIINENNIHIIAKIIRLEVKF